MVLAIHNHGVAEVRTVNTPPAVVVDGVAYPRIGQTDLAWLLQPATETTKADDLDAGTEDTQADEFAAGVHLGGNELATFILSREILERLDSLQAREGGEVDELVAKALTTFLDGQTTGPATSADTVKKLPGWTGWDKPTRAAQNRKRQRERANAKKAALFGTQDGGGLADAS